MWRIWAVVLMLFGLIGIAPRDHTHTLPVPKPTADWQNPQTVSAKSRGEARILLGPDSP
jgi:hypothetical protein